MKSIYDKRARLLALFITLLCDASLLLSAQSRTVTGIVTEASTSNPLSGVFVYVKGSSDGATTDSKGSYHLTLQSPDDIIVVSLLGYKEIQEKAGQRTTINFSLMEDMDYLDEVVVIGYGTLDKKELTSAIAHVNSKEFLATAGSDPSMLIQGKVAGVSVENIGIGDPNNQATIQIR